MIEQLPAMQQAPVGIGQVTASHVAPSPWYVPPMPSHPACVAIEHMPFKQQAPVAGGPVTASQVEPGPWNVPPAVRQAVPTSCWQTPLMQQLPISQMSRIPFMLESRAGLARISQSSAMELPSQSAGGSTGIAKVTL